MPTVRTFVAIELGPLRDALSRIQETLRRAPEARAGRWVRPEGIHLTLKFLGDVPEERLAQISEALDRAGAGRGPFTIRLAATGCFPHPRNPRVLWVGVEEPSGALAALQRAVDGELGKLGFEPEKRPFQPHLTLARIARGASPAEAARLAQATLATPVLASPTGSAPSMAVGTVAVIKSDLLPSGAVYTRLHASTLGG